MSVLSVHYRKSYRNTDSILKSRHHFSNKGLYSQSHGFSRSHVGVCELDHKEGWAFKNWCFWTAVLEKTLESLLDCKIKAVSPKGNQPSIFTGKTDAEAPISLATWCKELTHWKRPWCHKDYRQEEKGTTEAEMVGGHHRLYGYEFE